MDGPLLKIYFKSNQSKILWYLFYNDSTSSVNISHHLRHASFKCYFCHLFFCVKIDTYKSLKDENLMGTFRQVTNINCELCQFFSFGQQCKKQVHGSMRRKTTTLTVLPVKLHNLANFINQIVAEHKKLSSQTVFYHF